MRGRGRSSRADGSETRKGVTGGIETLDRRARKAVLDALEENEQSLFCVRASDGQAIVALRDRLLLVKAGRASASPIRPKVVAFRYDEIAAISIEVGEVNSVIEIAPLHGRPRREWWHSWIAFEDPLRAATTLVVRTDELQLYEPALQRLRTLVDASRGPSRTPASSGTGIRQSDLVSSLERLSALHAAGAISDDEFELAKQALLR